MGKETCEDLTPGRCETCFMLHLDVSKNSGFSPQIIHFNRVFHYFHHPFWGTLIFGNTHLMHGYGSIPRRPGKPSSSHTEREDQCLEPLSPPNLRRFKHPSPQSRKQKMKKVKAARVLLPKQSMHGIFTYFWLEFMVYLPTFGLNLWYIHLHLVDFYGKCR